MTPGMRSVLSAVLLTVVIMGLRFALAALRRWHYRRQAPGDEWAGFSIEQVEDLHRAGQISDAEFAALRRTALGLDEPPSSPDNSVTSGGEPADEDTMQGRG